ISHETLFVQTFALRPSRDRSVRALDVCAIGEYGGGIDPQIAREGEKWQLADIVVQAVDQGASAALVHPAVTRVDRLLRLLTGLPDTKGDCGGLACFGD